MFDDLNQIDWAAALEPQAPEWIKGLALEDATIRKASYDNLQTRRVDEYPYLGKLVVPYILRILEHTEINAETESLLKLLKNMHINAQYYIWFDFVVDGSQQIINDIDNAIALFRRLSENPLSQNAAQDLLLEIETYKSRPIPQKQEPAIFDDLDQNDWEALRVPEAPKWIKGLTSESWAIRSLSFDCLLDAYIYERPNYAYIVTTYILRILDKDEVNTETELLIEFLLAIHVYAWGYVSRRDEVVYSQKILDDIDNSAPLFSRLLENPLSREAAEYLLKEIETYKTRKPEPVHVVELTPDDWQLYKALRLEALYLEPQAFGSTYASSLQQPESFWRGRLEEAAAGQKSWLLFARRGDSLVGMIGAYTSDDPALVDVISMYVQPAHRGQGISKQLMNALLHTLGQQGQFERARLEVNTEQTAAQKLYASFGFQVIASEYTMAGDGKYHDVHIMEKRLR